ncbi:MAG: hypothetical protein JWP87_5274, partial [Labilithrix sp.]|nr:hypothetical protein [Labilithrix sp.]
APTPTPTPAPTPTPVDVATTSRPPSSAPPVAPSSAPPVVSPSMAPRRDTRREDSDVSLADAYATDMLHVDSDRPPRRGSSLAPPSSEARAPSELERQVQALRVELRAEVVARDKIEMHARDLASRLSSMSAQMSGLRARTSSEDATATARRKASIIPPAASDSRTRLSMRAPGLFAEIDELKSSIARLTADNESLRAAALGAPAPAPRKSGGRTDMIVPEVLERMVERIARLENVRAAVVAEDSGLVLAGSGELASSLAAFGAYIKDAASRSARLLPLRSADEVTVRDAHGLVFSTQVLGPPEAALALVTLVQGDVPVREMRVIVEHTPGVGTATAGRR